MRKLLLALVAILVVGICGILSAIGFFLFFGTTTASQAAPGNAPIVIHVDATTAPTQNPPATPSPKSNPVATALSNTQPKNATTATELSTLDQLTRIEFPPNDRVQLAEEYHGIVPVLATPSAPKRYKVGDKEVFWINRDIAQSANEQLTATLRYMNDVVYMWVEDGERIDDAALKKSADIFAEKIYPTDRKYLGSEATPGVDNDPHLHILNARFQNASGYFSQSDTLPLQVNRHSNQKEMFYINTRSIRPGNEVYDSVLAHEFAHMIHRNQNPRGDSTWITEGFGELGVELNGYQAGHEQAFAEDPDLQLNAWDVPGLMIPHYGAAYLFMSYQLNRFGVEYIRDVFSTTTSGIQTIQHALDKHEPGLTFNDVFADWVVANFINASELGTRYSYMSGNLGIRPTAGYNQYPAQGSDTVHQYGTDYIQLLPNGRDITFSFDGSDTVSAVPTDPYSGKYMWWSGRTDFSNASMTHEFDLSQVQQATLKFQTWYDLETDYDYAYASISTDGGKTWQTLKGNTTTTHDPSAANYGNAFNCKSGIGCDPQARAEWIEEVIDLTPFAGKKVLLRFQQITDEVYAAPGFVIDDIEIPEIGFKDDAESGDNGWQAKGFARIDNILPQSFIVQALEFGRTPRVVPIVLDKDNRGAYTTNGFGSDLSRVVIAVSASTPVTWEQADYQYSIQ